MLKSLKRDIWCLKDKGGTQEWAPQTLKTETNYWKTKYPQDS